LLRTLGFRGGIHPPRGKNSTGQLRIEVAPPPHRVIVPVLQHSGQAASINVRRGDRVRLGQIIAEPVGHNSAAVHSPVSGTVLSVSRFSHPCGENVLSAEIENDGQDHAVEMFPLEKPWKEAAPQEIVQKIFSCGIVGLGGVGIPAHLKLSPPANKPIDTIVVNCTDAEPLLTANRRLTVERTDVILTGALIIKKILGAKKTILVADRGESDLLSTLSGALKDPKFKDITLVCIASKYPQSEEKVIVKALTNNEIPSGGIAADVGCIVHNVATVYAIAEAVLLGTVLYRRVISVGGSCIGSPKNILVRIGTPVNTILEQCGVDMHSVKKVIMGGPMRGLALSDLGTPVIKTTPGIVAIDTLVPGVKQFDCINCGMCMRACPLRLLPSFLARFVEKNKIADAREWGILDCIECGSCAYVCPAKINLVHFLKLGKYEIDRLKRQNEAAAAGEKKTQ
jgi:electron transport complex protein RnfC